MLYSENKIKRGNMKIRIVYDGLREINAEVGKVDLYV
jgi:hypothetical protein